MAYQPFDIPCRQVSSKCSGMNSSVDRFMPSLLVVDTSVISRRIYTVFSRPWTDVLPLRDAVFSLHLLTGRQRLVKTRFIDRDFGRASERQRESEAAGPAS